ncbi:MAG: hypothetical protein JW708_03120, partial [Vallitaleaceae bacterium]|nr:hypothetical protein [Vallitaleaceae bacterium]
RKENLWEEQFQTYDSKQLSRMFYFMPMPKKNELLSILKADAKCYDGKEESYVIVNYEQRDFLRHNGEFVVVSIAKGSR